MLIDLVAGARPNFMKIAPIVRALDLRREAGGRLRYRLVHTGQHYDHALSDVFFSQLGLPDPDVHLSVGPGTPAEQTGAIMVGYESLLSESPSSLCLVAGDVTSTMACAICASKMGIPVAHVEAGIRSGDRSMPEEINRQVTDSVSDWFFTTSRNAGDNLLRLGNEAHRILFVGNTMIDTLTANLSRAVRPGFFERLGLNRGDYLLTTLHRPSNVDQPSRLAAILEALAAASRDRPVILPVHPRAAEAVRSLETVPDSLHPVTPQPYLEFIYLLQHATAVITDSGGVSEEATVLGIPCLTLRDTTERPETVTQGTNELLGTDPSAIAPALDRVFAGAWNHGSAPERWDGRSGEQIVTELERILPG